MKKIRLDPEKTYKINTKLPLVRNSLIDCSVDAFIFDNEIFFLIKVNNERYMKICLNIFTQNLEYFETYINYVDFKNLEQIVSIIKDLFEKTEIVQEINVDLVKEFDLECSGSIIPKEELTYCFIDDKYNYIDGVKQVKFYSDYKNPAVNYPNSELILILMKYGNHYEYCIMDYNLDKVVKFVLEKNRLTGQFRIIRNEFYQSWSKGFLFSQFNKDFKKLANNNSKDEYIVDHDIPLRHGTCGFHFYHFFTIGNYFEDLRD